MSLLIFGLALICLLPFTFSAALEEKITNLGQQKGNFLEGDIVMGDVPKARNAILKANRWPNGVLPYILNSTGYTQEHIDMIKEAMRTIEKHTCIRFKERTNEKDYLMIINYGSCSSNVGVYGGLQYVSLHNDSCFVHRTIIHELLHAIGLSHEQSRYDRNDYLTIHREKLVKDSIFEGVNLAIKTQTESSFYGIPFNYASVMQYDAWALGNGADGNIVMEPKDISMLGVMGFVKTANETDFEKVRRLYECKGKYPVVPPDNSPCEDEYDDCHIQSDRCKTHRGTAQGCRKTCGYCVWGGPITATPRPFCQDYRDDCGNQHWKDIKQCETNDDWRDRICPFTCGTCDRSKTRFPITTPTPLPCVDNIPYCKDYKSQCATQDALKDHCRKTCNFC